MRLGLKALTEHMCRVLNRNLRIWSCSITNLAKSYNKLFWKWDIWKDDYEKSKNLTSFFMEFAVRNKKGTRYQPLFRLPNMFRSFASCSVHHRTIFDALIHRGFGVFSKLLLVLSIWTQFHYFIIVPFSALS